MGAAARASLKKSCALPCTTCEASAGVARRPIWASRLGLGRMLPNAYELYAMPCLLLANAMLYNTFFSLAPQMIGTSEASTDQDVSIARLFLFLVLLDCSYNSCFSAAVGYHPHSRNADNSSL